MRRVALGVVLTLSLGLGLALALAVNGRMGHLRALPLPLPAWSAALDDSAGIMRGSALLGEVVIGWRLHSLGPAGPIWHIRLDAPGVALAAPAVLAPRAGRRAPLTLVLAPVTGHLDSAVWADSHAQGWPEARLVFTRGRLSFDPRHGRITALAAQGLASAVVIDDRALGEGRFSLRQRPEGDWRLTANLGNAGDADARFEIELRLDFVTGQAVLAVVPEAGLRDQGESVLRALTLPTIGAP